MNKIKKHNIMKRIFTISLVVLMVLLSLCSCGIYDNEGSENQKSDQDIKVESSDDINGLSVAVVTGSIQETIAQNNYPDSELVYFNDFTACLLAVETGKVQATIVPEIQYENIKSEYTNIMSLYPAMMSSAVHFVAPKNEESDRYLSEISAYITKSEKSGVLAEWWNKWNSNLDVELIDFSTLSGTNGLIQVAIGTFDRPSIYLSEGKYGGIDAEVLYNFCKEYGYTVDIAVYENSALVALLSTEKFNLAPSFVYTDERAEMVNYSEAYASFSQVAVVSTSILKNEPMYRSIDDLQDKIIAVCTGTMQESISRSQCPNAEFINYSSFPDCLIAVSEGKVDSSCVPETQLRSVLDAYDNLTVLQKPAHEASLYLCMSKTSFGAKINAEMTEFLNNKKASGELKEIKEYWLENADNQDRTVYDFSKTPDTNGTVEVAFEPLNTPNIHMYLNGYSGYEAQILYEFALEYGYRLNVRVTDWASVLAGVSSGKYDLTGYVYYSDERAESILFSPDYWVEATYFVVQKSENSQAQSKNFWNKIKSSFEKNFIREDHWKLMLDGLGVTIEIMISTAILGTLFGIVLCFVRRGKSRVAGGITKVFVRIMQGVPIVVLLLVMYYIIFAKSTISGILVGIIGFSIDFGVYVSEILRSGIDSVDKGQWEAAYALGFNKYRTYTKVIMPQALQYALPVYKGQFISMVKMTSVVGYVAVQDLTKASDIIRSRTYDAFMPIIATAIVYFILAWLMTTLLGLVEIKIDPSRRRNILADIDTTAVDLSKNNFTKAIPQKNTSGDSAEEIIKIEHLRKEYENVTPLVDVNAVVRKGDIISIIGPSGTGKSTLIRMINRLEEPTSGTVYAFGKKVDSHDSSIHELREKMAMVFQAFNLFNHLTIIENIMLAPVLLKGISRQDAYEKGMKLLQSVGLAEKALNYPAELSGGQKQRVAIVRALAMDPEVMLLDEPTSALDPGMTNEVLHVIEDLAESGMTMLIITHEMKFAQSVSNRVFYMDEGSIYEEGSTQQIFGNPQKEKTKAFIYHLKLFSFDIESPDFDFINLRTSLDTFAYQQMMKGKIQTRLMLCTEELVTQGLAYLSSDYFPAKFNIEYGEDNVLKAYLNYHGDRKDISEDIDEISIRIIKSLIDEFEYQYINNENEIRFTIRP